jgi:hypothetical protein
MSPVLARTSAITGFERAWCDIGLEVRNYSWSSTVEGVLEQGRVTPDCKILDVESLISHLFYPKRERERERETIRK